jgi:hypothetical protein
LCCYWCSSPALAMAQAIATGTISGVVTSVSLAKWPIESPV